MRFFRRRRPSDNPPKESPVSDPAVGDQAIRQQVDATIRIAVRSVDPRPEWWLG